MSDFFPLCKNCSGSGKVTVISRGDTRCPRCRGTGNRFFPSCGPQRNKAMVLRGLEFDTYECLGVWDWTSRGTWGCMTLAHAAGYPLTLLDMKHRVTNSWPANSQELGQFLLKHEPKRRSRRS